MTRIKKFMSGLIACSMLIGNMGGLNVYASNISVSHDPSGSKIQNSLKQKSVDTYKNKESTTAETSQPATKGNYYFITPKGATGTSFDKLVVGTETERGKIDKIEAGKTYTSSNTAVTLGDGWNAYLENGKLEKVRSDTSGNFGMGVTAEVVGDSVTMNSKWLVAEGTNLYGRQLYSGTSFKEVGHANMNAGKNTTSGTNTTPKTVSNIPQNKNSLYNAYKSSLDNMANNTLRVTMKIPSEVRSYIDKGKDVYIMVGANAWASTQQQNGAKGYGVGKGRVYVDLEKNLITVDYRPNAAFGLVDNSVLNRTIPDHRFYNGFPDAGSILTVSDYMKNSGSWSGNSNNLLPASDYWLDIHHAVASEGFNGRMSLTKFAKNPYAKYPNSTVTVNGYDYTYWKLPKGIAPEAEIMLKSGSKRFGTNVKLGGSGNTSDTSLLYDKSGGVTYHVDSEVVVQYYVANAQPPGDINLIEPKDLSSVSINTPFPNSLRVTQKQNATARDGVIHYYNVPSFKRLVDTAFKDKNQSYKRETDVITKTETIPEKKATENVTIKTELEKGIPKYGLYGFSGHTVKVGTVNDYYDIVTGPNRVLVKPTKTLDIKISSLNNNVSGALTADNDPIITFRNAYAGGNLEDLVNLFKNCNSQYGVRLIYEVTEYANNIDNGGNGTGIQVGNAPFIMHSPLPAGVVFKDEVTPVKDDLKHRFTISGKGEDIAKMVKVLDNGEIGIEFELRTQNIRGVKADINTFNYLVGTFDEPAKTILKYPVDAQGTSPAGEIEAIITATNLFGTSKFYNYKQGNGGLKLTGNVTVAAENGYELNESKNLASKSSDKSEKGTTAYANIKLAPSNNKTIEEIRAKQNAGYTNAVITGTSSWNSSIINSYTVNGGGTIKVEGNNLNGNLTIGQLIGLLESVETSNIKGTTTKFKNDSLSPQPNPAQDTLQSLNTGVLSFTNVKVTLKGNGLQDSVIEVDNGNFGSGTWNNTVKAQPQDTFKAHIVKNRSDIVPAKPDGSLVRIAAEIPWNLTETSEGLKQGKHYEYPKDKLPEDTTIPAEQWQMKLNIRREASSSMGNNSLGAANFQVPGWIFPKVVLNSGNFGYAPATVLKELVNSFSVYQTIFDESSRDFIIRPGEVITLTYTVDGSIIIPDVDNPGKTKTIPIQPAICKNTFTGVSEETFSYRSEPKEYAEIKQGTPGNEEFEAMAGVPSTDVLHLSAGGSEFVVAVETQYVQQATTERKYTATWRSRPEDEGNQNNQDSLDRSAHNARYVPITEVGTNKKLDFHTGENIGKTFISGNITDSSVNNLTTSDEDNKKNYYSNAAFVGKEVGFEWRRQDDYRDNTSNGGSAGGNNYVELNNGASDPKEQLLPYHRPYIWQYVTNGSVDGQKGSILIVEDADVSTVEKAVCEGKYFWFKPPRGKGAITQGTQTSSPGRANSSEWYPQDKNGYTSIGSLIPGTPGNNAPAQQSERELLGWKWPNGQFIHDNDAIYNADSWETPSDTSLWVKSGSDLGFNEPEEHLEPLVQEPPSASQYDWLSARQIGQTMLSGGHNPYDNIPSPKDPLSKWVESKGTCAQGGSYGGGSTGNWCSHEPPLPAPAPTVHAPHEWDDGGTTDSDGVYHPNMKSCIGGTTSWSVKSDGNLQGAKVDNGNIIVSSIDTYHTTQKAQWYQARSAKMQRTWNWFRPALPQHFGCNWGYTRKYNNLAEPLEVPRLFNNGDSLGYTKFTDSNTTLGVNVYSASHNARPYDNIMSATSQGFRYHTFTNHLGNPLTDAEKVRDYLGNLEIQCSAVADGFTDTWIQRETYDYMKINSIKVYEIDSAEIEQDSEGKWLNDILKGKPTDKIKAEIVQGDPTIYANIAKNNTSKDGRKVHSLYTSLHDDVVIPASDLINNGIVDNSHANLYPAGLELGHKTERDFVNNVLKPKLNTTTIVSDFAILQTTGGDQVVLYFEKDMPTMATGSKFNYVGTELVQKSSPTIMWNNNPSAIVTWDPQTSINVGGYNGNFMQPKNKYSLAGNKAFNTIFQGKGAVNEAGLNKFGQHRTGIRTPIRIQRLDLNIEPTTPNGEKSTGIVKNYYTVTNDARNLYAYANNETYGGDTIIAEDREDFNWDAGTGVKEAVYGDANTDYTGKVNDLVIHTPVSTQYVLVQELPKELDQRTSDSLEKAVDNMNQDSITIQAPGDIPDNGYTWKWPMGKNVATGLPSNSNLYGHDNVSSTIGYWVEAGKNQLPSEAPLQYKRRFVFPDTGLPIPVGYVGANGKVYNKVEWFPYEGMPSVPELAIRQWEYTLNENGKEHSRGLFGNQFSGQPPVPAPQTLVGDLLKVVAGNSYNGKTFKWVYPDGSENDGGVIFEGIDNKLSPKEKLESRLEWRWSDSSNPNTGTWWMDGNTQASKPGGKTLKDQASMVGWNFNGTADGWGGNTNRVKLSPWSTVLNVDVVGDSPYIYRRGINIEGKNISNVIVRMYSNVKYLPKDRNDSNKNNSATLRLEVTKNGTTTNKDVKFQLAWGDSGYVNYAIGKDKLGVIDGNVTGIQLIFPNEPNKSYRIDFIDITTDIKNAGSQESLTGNGLKTYTTPAKGTYSVEIWGAQGGNNGSNSGGKGAYVKSLMDLSAGETITFSVGRQDGLGGGGLGSSNGGGATHVFIGGGHHNFGMDRFSPRAGTEYRNNSMYTNAVGEGIYGPYFAVDANTTYIVQVFGNNLDIGIPVLYYNGGANSIQPTSIRRTDTFTEYTFRTPNTAISNMELCYHQDSAGDMRIDLVTIARWPNKVMTAGGGGGATSDSVGKPASGSAINGTGNYAGQMGNGYTTSSSEKGIWYHNDSGCTYYGEYHNTTSKTMCTFCNHSCGRLDSWKTEPGVAKQSGGGGGGHNGGTAGTTTNGIMGGGNGGGSQSSITNGLVMKSGSSSMPSPNGGTEVGHSGNGAYKVTLVGGTSFVNGEDSLWIAPIPTLQGSTWMTATKKYLGTWNLTTQIKELKVEQALVEIDKTKKYTAVETKTSLKDVPPALVMGVPIKTIQVPNNMISFDKTTGETVNGASFLVVDAPFKVFYPNIGDFQGNNALGIGSLTPMRGLGYVDDMDTTKWTREKWITLDFDVISKNVCDVTVDWQVGDKKVTKTLPMTFEAGKQPKASYEKLYKAGEPIAIDVNSVWLDFYIPLEQDEKAKVITEFNSVAINSPEVMSTDGEVPRNLDRFEKLAARHNSIKQQNLDLIGRIGNLAITDTGDPRWSNFFKSPIVDKDGNIQWYIPNLIPSVDTSSQKNYLGDRIDIRGIAVNNIASRLNTWGKVKFLEKEPSEWSLTPDRNTISPFRGDGVALGYNWLGELSTLGNYDKVEIMPVYYYLDTSSESNTPIEVDLYSYKNGNYIPLNMFQDKHSAGVTGGTEPTYNEVDLVKQAGRRNIYGAKVGSNGNVLEASEIDRSKEAYNRRKETSATTIKPISETKTGIGNSQLITLDGRTTTYIGSSSTYGFDKNPGDRVQEIDYVTNGQRWHYSLGLPTSTVVIPRNQKPCVENTLSSDKGYILVTLDIKATGETWDLSYIRPEFAQYKKGDDIVYSDSKVPLMIGGKVFDISNIPLNYALIGVYDSIRTARDEFDTSGDR